MPVAVVTDSTHYLPRDLIAEYEIHQVSLYVNDGGTLTREGEMPDFHAFYEDLRTRSDLPTTSQPSPGDFIAVYEPLIEQGYDIVSVHLGAGISGTCDSARQAAAELTGDGSQRRIEVVDSASAAGGLALIVLAAASAARGGRDVEAVKARTLARTKTNVMDALIGAVSFDVPKALVDSECQARVQAARAELTQRGVPNADKMPIPADAFITEAERRVRLGLLVSELVQQAQLQAKPEQVRARIEEFAGNYEKPAEVVSYYLSDRARRAEVEGIVLEDNVVQHALAKAQVEDEQVPFDQIMGTA